MDFADLPQRIRGIQEPEAVLIIYDVSTGDSDRLLVDAEVLPQIGSGPAGALLSHAHDTNLNAVGLIVETDPRFPDRQDARILIEQGSSLIVGADIDTDPLVEQAEGIIE